MVQVETNPMTVRKWMEAKQTNEQELLRRLNYVFHGRDATATVRRVVRTAFERMWAEVQATPFAAAVYGALVAEADLAVWAKLRPVSALPFFRLERMLLKLRLGEHDDDPLDCNDLSELIRVIGAWLERGGGHGGVPDIHKAYRTGVDKIPATAPHGKGLAVKQQKALDDKLWKTGVTRSRSGPGDPERNPIPIEPHVAQAWVRPKQNKISGLQRFRVDGEDVCRKIDLMFGLLPGATISGTTTDTVMVFEAFGAQKAGPKIWITLHPGYYLFPVATIAASLHHTMLEAGLALTVVDAIRDYEVGFYKSLVPAGGLPNELAKVGEYLGAAEDDMRNRYILAWYENYNDTPTGCICWDRTHKEEYRKLVSGKELMRRVNNMRKFPSRNDVVSLIQDRAPSLLTFDLKRKITAVLA